jgi:hypothetical protein
VERRRDLGIRKRPAMVSEELEGRLLLLTEIQMDEAAEGVEARIGDVVHASSDVFITSLTAAVFGESITSRKETLTMTDDRQDRSTQSGSGSQSQQPGQSNQNPSSSHQGSSDKQREQGQQGNQAQPHQMPKKDSQTSDREREDKTGTGNR